MSVTVKDHRKFIEGKEQEAAKAEAEQPKPLLPQAEINYEVGEEKLDKMLRAIAAKLEKDQKHVTAVAEEVAGAVQEDLVRLKQFEYFYTKGRIDACKEISMIPAQIVLEARPQLSEGHA